jgi:hypothetical protein
MFRRGQRVECIVERSSWHRTAAPPAQHPPAFGEICRIAAAIVVCGREWVGLEGWETARWFTGHSFRPIVESELERLREIAENPSPPTPHPPNDKRELVVDFGDPERTLCVRGVPQGEKEAEAEHV